jgi:multidrug efflux system outer membrane protein
MNEIAHRTIAMTHRPSLSVLLAAMVLAGCASTAELAPPAPPAAPTAFKEVDGRWADAAPADAASRGPWWSVFADPTLDALIDQADQRNTSIQAAAARLAQARALWRGAEADRVPQVGLAAGVSRQTLPPGLASRPGQAQSVGSLGASLSYEADLFGRLAKASDAAALDAQSREALWQSTRLLVQANVAQAYFNLRALDTERALVRETVEAYRDTLRLTERRFAAGDVAQLDLARVQTEVAATQSQALALDRQRTQLEHALAVLVGELPSSFSLAEAEWQGSVPRVPPGLPSTLLTRRPDVSAAQSAMRAAQARVGVARTAWFPQLALTADGGVASTELGDLFKWSARSWGIGALLSLPVFDGGRRQANLRVAHAQWDAAAANYREQVLVAFQDVEDQLAALRLLADQADAQAQAVQAAARATVLSSSRYRNGLVSQLELLDARRSELANRRQAVQLRSAQFQAAVGLIRALGGGWTEASPS